MPITSNISADGSEAVIVVEGRFDFSLQIPFRQAYESIATKPKRFRVDMGGASYLDKSALGMLLLLRDFAGGDSADVAIVNSNNDVRGTLQRANFDKLFTIS